MIKGSIQEEDITIVNIYAPNMRAPQYRRQALTNIKGEMDSNTIIVGDFNTPHTPMDRSSEKKMNKETQVLKDTLDEMDLIDIQDISSKCRIHLLLKCTWNISRINHILVTNQTSVNLRKLKSYQASSMTTIP